MDHDQGDRLLGRIAATGIGLLATLAYGYAIYGISQVPLGDGSGFQWVALGPYTLLYAAVVAMARYVYDQNRSSASIRSRPAERSARR
jgi:hypothetical protein